MSKSYKKYPKIKQDKLSKSDKTILNKRLRKTDKSICYKGSQYKKRLHNWNIWQYRWTWEDAINDWHNKEYLQDQYPTLKDFRNYYESCVLRK